MRIISSTQLHVTRRAFLVTAATSLAIGPLIGVAEVMAVFYWFSLIEGFNLGPMRLEALALSYGMALLPAFLGGMLLAVIDQIVASRVLRLLLVGAAGFAAAFSGLTLLLGAGDIMGATIAGLAGILPAYGCKAVARRLLHP